MSSSYSRPSHFGNGINGHLWRARRAGMRSAGTESPFSGFAIARRVALDILVLVIACFPGYGREIALILLIVGACGPPAWTLRSLIAGYLVSAINPAFFGEVYTAAGSAPLAILKWTLLFVATGRSLLTPVRPTPIYTRIMGAWAVGTAMLLINSIFVSALPTISMFKTISFSIGLLCLIRLAMQTADRNAEMLLSVAELGIAVFVTSASLIRSEIGYSLNGVGLNGVLNHPQTLGVFLVMTGCATFAVARKLPSLSMVLVPLGLAQWALIYFTAVRTAVIALAIGGIAFLIESFGAESRVSQKRARLAYVLTAGSLLAGLGIVLTLIAFPAVSRGFGVFLAKGHEGLPYSFESREDLSYVLSHSSRGDQIFDTLNTAEEHFLFGFGFGVDEGLLTRLNMDNTRWGSVPLTAPIEQGFLPLATVAQIGIVGTLLGLPFLVILYGAARRESAMNAGFFGAVLGVTFGEMIFYSVGGLGLLMWIVLMLLTVNGANSRIPARRFVR